MGAYSILKPRLEFRIEVKSGQNSMNHPILMFQLLHALVEVSGALYGNLHNSIGLPFAHFSEYDKLPRPIFKYSDPT